MRSPRRAVLLVLAAVLVSVGGGVAAAASTGSAGPAGAHNRVGALITRAQARRDGGVGIDIPIPAPIGLPATGSTPDPYVHACGMQLCLEGKTFPLKMASVYAIDAHRATDISLAQQGGLNTVRLVNMLQESGPVSGAYDEATWDKVDADIAAAHAAGLHVELDLSSYRNLLLTNGLDPYTQDWQRFLTFVADRVNTVTGVRYADDPTIALVTFAGELAPPGYGHPAYTASNVYSFFTRTFAEWRALDPHHLTSTGGMLFLNDTTNAGIDWQHLMTLPGNDVCAMHVYSQLDVNEGMPNLAGWCAAKPWIVEEYGAAQSSGDASRAAFFRQVTAAASRLHAAGVGYWNLGPEVASSSHDVSPAFPQTWLAARSQP